MDFQASCGAVSFGIFKAIMREFALFEECDKVMTYHTPPLFNLLYQSANFVRLGERNHKQFHLCFDVHEQVLILNQIVIPESHRGVGHGAKLYLITEEVGRILGAKCVQQTGSGTTGRGEPRTKYLERIGYIHNGTHMIKELV